MPFCAVGFGGRPAETTRSSAARSQTWSQNRARRETLVTARSARTIAWSVGLASIALLIGELAFRYIDRSTTRGVSNAWSAAVVFDVLVDISIPVLGIVIASRRRENPIGWVFLLAGAALAISSFARSYAVHALVADPGSLPAGRAVAWLGTWIEPIAICLLPFLFLLFPTGHLSSERWRPLVWICFAILILAPASMLVFATTIWDRPFADFQDAVSGGGVATAAAVLVIGSVVALVLALFASAVSLIARFRGSVGEERLQLKWFVTAAAVVAVAFCVQTFADTSATELIFDGAVVLLVASIAVAILRYHLYDIDVLLGKAIVYGVLGAFITVVYVVVVVVIGAIFGPTEGLALIATAIVAVAAHPVRERARHAANRFVYGNRATPYEVLSGFSESVAAAYAGEDILPRMARLLAEGTGATRATVWLRVRSDLRPGATWPTASDPDPPKPLVDGQLPLFPGANAAVAVRHGDELLGALTVSKPPRDPIRPEEEKLIAELGVQAGLVLNNFRLIEDLRSSRQRLVAAQDEERRRLERNLHDGAQQQLVALAVKVRLAESLIGKDDEQRRALQAIQDDAQEALDNLRETARGIYPPLLADQGLQTALEAHARRTALPVTFEFDGVERYPPDVEAAIYFFVLEALQNVAKYADASSVTIRLREWEGDIDVSVIDDGRGFDPEATPLGMGLQNMSDRLAALGGRLEIKSVPGRGTNVFGRVPIPAGAG
jgi:signal transduction histidine kinase